ncbi:MAG: FAD synthetase family protein [Treponema sp.]|nr:FAD synthetase family protein [Treponema sp.]
MRIIEWPEFLKKGLQAGTGLRAITIGVFDGVHRGHQALIERIVQSGLEPLIITFRENHKNRSERQGRLLSFRQKADIFESLGAAVTVAAELNDSLKNLPGAEFIRLLWERGGMGFLAIGNNFRCGRSLDTDAAAIQKHNASKNITTFIAEPVMEGPLPVSSSRIREAIFLGKLEEAASMLGRPYSIDLRQETPLTDGQYLFYKNPGCVLPPDGTYKVMLCGENYTPEKQAEICIEGEAVFLPVQKQNENYRNSLSIEFCGV